jgi:hypothetical protein
LVQTNKLPQQYLLPNRTRNAYQLALDLSILSQQLAITTHLTHNFCTLLISRFGHFPRLCWDLYHDCLNVVNDEKHLWVLWNSVYHSVVVESLNSLSIHFRTYIDLNYFYTYQELIPEVMLWLFEYPIHTHTHARTHTQCTECRLMGCAGSFWELLMAGTVGFPSKLKVIHSVMDLIQWVIQCYAIERYRSVILLCSVLCLSISCEIQFRTKFSFMIVM